MRARESSTYYFMIASGKSMNLICDFKAVSEGKGFPRSIGTFFLNPCWHTVCLYRLSSQLYRLHLEPFAKITWYLNRVLYSVDIDYRAKLAPGFKLVHGLGVVVGSGVVSEGPLSIYQSVTIGGTMGKERIGVDGSIFTQPHFGKNVTVYTGTCLFGPIYVGDNARILANRTITRDVPSETTI